MQALSILVQHPEVVGEFSEADYEKLGHVEDVLGAVALAVLREDLSSPGLLMEHFQGTPLFGDIRHQDTAAGRRAIPKTHTTSSALMASGNVIARTRMHLRLHIILPSKYVNIC